MTRLIINRYTEPQPPDMEKWRKFRHSYCVRLWTRDADKSLIPALLKPTKL